MLKISIFLKYRKDVYLIVIYFFNVQQRNGGERRKALKIYEKVKNILMLLVKESEDSFKNRFQNFSMKRFNFLSNAE